MSPGTAQLKGFFRASAHTCRPSRPPLWPLVSWAWRGGVHKRLGLWGGVCPLTIDALVSCWILQLCPQVVLPEAHSQPLPSSSPPSPLVPHPRRTSAAGSVPSLGSWRPHPPSPPPEALVSCSSTLHPGNLGFRPQGQARGGPPDTAWIRVFSWEAPRPWGGGSLLPRHRQRRRKSRGFHLEPGRPVSCLLDTCCLGPNDVPGMPGNNTGSYPRLHWGRGRAKAGVTGRRRCQREGGSEPR